MTILCLAPPDSSLRCITTFAAGILYTYYSPSTHLMFIKLIVRIEYHNPISTVKHFIGICQAFYWPSLLLPYHKWIPQISCHIKRCAKTNNNNANNQAYHTYNNGRIRNHFLQKIIGVPELLSNLSFNCISVHPILGLL